MLPEIFKIHEKELIEKIRNSESPFLGLFGDYFKESTRKLIISFIQKKQAPVREFTESMLCFPALLSTLLVVQILEEFGEKPFFEVYPAIEKVFGKELTNPKKEELWRSFRRACVSNLGLSVSPRTSGTHYMVEEYLRQAGLPLHYVGRFTEKALVYAHQSGIPDIDDPESLKLWQHGLVEELVAPFSVVARRAIERDKECYYSQQFINLLSHPPVDSHSLTRVQRLILETIIEGPKVRAFKRAAIPQIVIRELEYGILLPGGDRQEWQINISDKSYVYASQVDERFISFETSIPSHISCRNEAGAKWEYPLWQDEKNNRLLIFSLPAGKFIKQASLLDKEIFIDPGDYLLLLRFQPEESEDVEVFSENPSLYLKKIHLNPGQKFSINRGPAELIFDVDDIPVLNFVGESIQGVRGNELYPAKGLKLETVIPYEMINTGVEFYLKLKSRSLGEERIVELTNSSGNFFILDIGNAIAEWKAGVSRLLIELYRRDSARPLARKSAIVWNGLIQVEKRISFQCSRMPENLFRDDSENIKADDVQQMITFRDETNRFFKMVLKMVIESLVLVGLFQEFF